MPGAFHGHGLPGLRIIETDAMTTAEEEIGLAARDDIAGMLELQGKNVIDRGGLLSVAFSREFFETAIAGMPVIVARKDGRVIGYVLSSPLPAHAHLPIIKAMLRSYRGSAGAYLYGPICVEQNERGRGLAGRLFAALRKQLPRREGILFIRRKNASSLGAHAKMGLREVAEFTHEGVAHAVMSYLG
jgi:L-amino acid N-acyltransferase YncA